MATVFLQHQVADYDAWRPVYDDDKPRREAAHMNEVGVFRGADDPNNVLLVFESASLDGVHEMLGSDDLQEKMKEAGVTSEPKVWIAG